MTKKAYDKIAPGLAEALAYAKDDPVHDVDFKIQEAVRAGIEAVADEIPGATDADRLAAMEAAIAALGAKAGATERSMTVARLAAASALEAWDHASE